MQMKNKIFSLIIIFLMTNLPARAGTVGTLVGTVVEKENRNPLPGANVIIEGTQIGAATDLNGNFIIHNVPAGFYAVKIMVIGYQVQMTKNVEIVADHKTTINVELQQEAIQGEVVEVIAKRPHIQPDVTSSIHFVSKKQIDQQPVTSFREVMELQPGVASGGHIRGGRATEVLYLIDGIPVQQAMAGGSAADLPKGALEEITLQSGGFNAEYGGGF
jgi:hypothetical protein